MVWHGWHRNHPRPARRGRIYIVFDLADLVCRFLRFLTKRECIGCFSVEQRVQMRNRFLSRGRISNTEWCDWWRTQNRPVAVNGVYQGGCKSWWKGFLWGVKALERFQFTNWDSYKNLYCIIIEAEMNASESLVLIVKLNKIIYSCSPQIVRVIIRDISPQLGNYEVFDLSIWLDVLWKLDNITTQPLSYLILLMFNREWDGCDFGREMIT